MKKILNRLISIYSALAVFILKDLPGPIGSRLRTFLYRPCFSKMGKGVVFGTGVRFFNGLDIEIGNNVFIGSHCTLTAGPPIENGRWLHRVKSTAAHPPVEGKIILHDHVALLERASIQGHGGVFLAESAAIASGCQVYSMTHHYRTFNTPPAAGLICKVRGKKPSEESLILGPVVIEKYVTVLPNSIVLPGVTIGEGTWVSPCSVVKKSLSPYKIASGNPALAIKDRAID